MKSNEYIRDLVAEMQQNDKPKHDDARSIDKMIHCDWELPPELQNMAWVRAVRSTDPHDAVKTGSRILSTTRPIFRIHPVGPLEENRQVTSEIERAISWQYNIASRRTTNVTRDIVESALRYDEICVHVMFLPWHKSNVLAGSGGSLPPQWEHATRAGSYVLLVENPQDVHYRYNFLGLECLALVKVMRAEDAYVYYQHPDIFDDIKNRQNKESYITVFDYWDYYQRESFGYLHDTAVKAEAGGEPDYIFQSTEMDLPFIPWAIKRGGTALERDKRFQVHPILAPMVWAKVWEDQNVAESLAFGESIAYAAAPRGVIENDYGQIVDIDYHEPNKPIRLQAGQKYVPIPPPEIDQSLLEIGDRLKARGDKATVARFLQNLDFPSGSAFATVNAVIKSATSALDPAKELAEETLAEVAKLMLMYVHHTTEPIIGYENTRTSDLYGTQYSVSPDDFDPAALFIDVKLTANIPTDHQQRVNTAVMMQERLDWPKARTYEFLDVPDGDIAMDERRREKLVEQEFLLAMKERQAEVERAIQNAMVMEQLAMQKRVQALQQSDQRASAAREGFGQTRGQGFNPADGGASPMVANPTATRETITGQDRSGESLA